MTAASERAVVETLAVFGLVFFVQTVASLLGAVQVVSGLFVLSAPLSEYPWTLVTSVYAHSGTGHLIANAITLVVVGWPVARATTRPRFHAFFVLTGALAGGAQVLLTVALAAVTGGPAGGGVLGASGAVFALMGYLIAGNRLSDVLASRIDVPVWLTLLVFLTLAMTVTLVTAAPRVALGAHFTGFLIGLLAGRMGVLERPAAGKPSR